MMNSYGKNFRLAIFGESHGPAIGITIDGVPAGFKIDFEKVRADLKRRAPGNSDLTTTRKEADEFEILSGVKDGVATGFPIAITIKNTNTRSSDYDKVLRPSHADWTALLKYGGHADMAGGGHFSGRLTAPLVFAGAIAKQLLREHGTEITAKIVEIEGVSGGGEESFKERILAAKENLDSVGGVIEVISKGVPAGLGEPFFGSVESELAALLFSVPAVKGVEFGAGFGITKLRGSEANDELTVENGRIVSKTNNNGGILGGISNGMPIVVRVAVKPTASIGKEQGSVDPDTMEEVRLSTSGRHDPCILPRALPVMEAVVAIGLYDLFAEHNKGGAQRI
ncbi:MAG: chorismate synthase [Clostridiales Family XIII bacterium]|nr:chorismate synthase [Clostridiales Family XIII bacterium]